MKTLAHREDCAEIVSRLRTLTLESRRQWGRMTVAEMICHLTDALRVAMGEKSAQSVSNVFSRSVLKWVALKSSMRWPHGFSTVPECEAGAGGTAPMAFDRDMSELCAQIERFSSRHREFASARHPIFGELTVAEWLRWGYLHMDHHLRQFGA